MLLALRSLWEASGAPGAPSISGVFPPRFPSLAGQGWSVHKKPVFSTNVASHVSGREVRTAFYLNPIWEFELVFDGLDSTAAGIYGGLGAQSLQTLMNLFMVCQGQYGTFLYVDPTDNAASDQIVAVGDGVTSSFTLARQLVAGGFIEPVGWVTAVSEVTVAGAPASDATIETPNTLVFAAPPASGAAIAWSGAFAFQCRFDDDQADFEQFMSNLWKLDGLKFRSVRAS